ncbi:SPOR domain-containing protein [Paenibacillus alkaliterrae]|uniref:SPOR domain-containing protein n=1 Tax=Paenibacillus alkaliterrae TaxID=320909 RepID=UPI001F201C3E|nr:SPOR domain-containing protein [Paenibacillus alkaliterrae]MCF2937307.1 SPOR domain-containing protein [Paenibacillus alkaliterrae]
MNQKNRITYRFDRAGNSISENNRLSEKQQEADYDTKTASSQTSAHGNIAKPAKENVIPLYPFNDQHAINEINPWNSPFQEDIGALEQLIRNTDSITDAKTDGKTMTPNAVQPFPAKAIAQIRKPLHAEAPVTPAIAMEFQESTAADDEEDGLLFNDSVTAKSRTIRMNRSPAGPSWFNVFLSVAGALATGALFGYLLLSLFTGATIWPAGSKDKLDSNPAIGGSITDDPPSGTTANSNTNNVDKGDSLEADNKPDPKPDPSAQTISLTGLDKSYYMLQFGVFSNTAGRDAALAQLADKGLAAAAMTGSSDYRVYAGMAGDRDKAQAIRDQLSDLLLYIKEVTISTPDKLPFNGEAAAAQGFFDQTGELVRMLDELALAQLEQPSLSQIGQAAAKAWQTEYQKWTESADAIRIDITDAKGKAYSKKLIQSIEKAAKAMLDYDKKPSRAHLWSTQSALMEAVISQKEWFETISAL